VAPIFATFPFSYEAVAYVAAFFHPFLTFWVLLTLLLYRRARLSGSPLHRAVAHLTLILGLFSHENGLFIPLALVGLEWLVASRHQLDHQPPQAIARRLLPFFVAPALFLALWFSIPKTGEQPLLSLSAVFNNSLPFWQTLVYPLLPALSLEANNPAGLFILGVAVITATYFLARMAGAQRLWLFALAWTGLSAAPSILFLETGYLYGSPRLQYLPSLGVGLLWGLPVLALTYLEVATVTRRLAVITLSGVVALAVLLPPLPFLNCQLDFYARASHIVRSMSDLASEAQPDRELVFINIPFFFSSYAAHPEGCPNPYPWTPVGTVVIPPYARTQDFVRVNGGPNHPTHGYTFEAYDPGWSTHGQPLSAADLRNWLSKGQVFVFDLYPNLFFDLNRAWHPTTSISDHRLANFANLVELENATISKTRRQLEITLHWQAVDTPSHPLTAFVHLYDAAGTLVAQHDAPPAQGYVPPSLWQAGHTITDRHVITLPASLNAGSYTLAVGLYDPLSGQRLAAFAGHTALTDNVYVIAQLTLP
jgi:hypothetical protein